MPRSRENLLCCVMALVAFGLVMSYSVASARAAVPADGLKALGRHALYAALGAGALWALSRLDYRRLYDWHLAIMGVSLVLLVLVLIPGVGALRNNARRWFSFAGVSLQPSEFAKLALVVGLSAFVAADPNRVGKFFRGFLPGLALAGATAGLVLLGPDFGTAALLGSIGVLILLVGGAKAWHTALAAAPGVLGGAFLIYRSPFRFNRVMAFLNPWDYYDGPGYQVVQSLVALGNGGVLGAGPGASVQKLFFLPEPGTDFVYAILGEEFGMAGTLAVLALFAVFLVEGMRVSGRAPDLFGSLLAFGLTATIALQAAINIAVVTASVPTKGIPLPFISMGGSSLLFCMAASGILLNIAAQSEPAEGRAPGSAGFQPAPVPEADS